MANTRSQSRSSIPVFMDKANGNDRVSDSESECSIPDLLTRDQIDELDNETLIHSGQHSDQMTIDQRFSSMNKQINELTGLVLALTEKLSSSHGEGNDQNTVTSKTSARSDTWVFESLSSWCFVFACYALIFLEFNTKVCHIKAERHLRLRSFPFLCRNPWKIFRESNAVAKFVNDQMCQNLL